MGKDKIITFKIEEEAKKAFEDICKGNYTTVSQKLYAFVHQSIKHSGGKISLTEFRENKS